MNKKYDKNNINKSKIKKSSNNQENKNNKISFLCFEYLKLNRNGILLLLFLFNLIILLVAFSILTSIKKKKYELGVEKINEEEFNKKLNIIYLLNEFSMGCFDIIKSKIEERLNKNHNNNQKNKRKIYEINNKNDIEYKKSNITKNGNIYKKILKALIEDYNRNPNFYSKNESALKQDEKYLNKKGEQPSDALLVETSNSHYLRTSLKSIIYLTLFLWKIFE